MRVDGRGASLFAGLALVAACGARTEPWSMGGGAGGGPTTGTAGNGGFGAGTGISTGVGAGGTSTGTGGAGTGTGGTGAAGTGAGGSGTGGGAGRGGAGGGAGTGTGATGGRAGAAGAAGAGGSPPDAGLPCLGRNVFTILEFDFYFLMEKSASMGTIDMTTGVSRWAASERAISAFLSVNGPSANGSLRRVGMGFFPESTGSASCSAATYATPSVPFVDYWQNRAAFVNAMQAQTLGGYAPTAPALEGALSYAAQWAKIPYPFSLIGPPSVILVTDGEPDMCSSTIDSSAALAAAAFNATLRIKTFVIDVGGATGRLDAIARAGGTSRAYVGVAPRSPLDAILKSRYFCEIPLPIDEDAGSPVTRVHVQTNLPNLRITDPLAFLRQVPGPSACGVDGGWFLDPPAAPTLIMLCPDTCRALADNEESRIVVWRACEAPPNGL